MCYFLVMRVLVGKKWGMEGEMEGGKEGEREGGNSRGGCQERREGRIEHLS